LDLEFYEKKTVMFTLPQQTPTNTAVMDADRGTTDIILGCPWLQIYSLILMFHGLPEKFLNGVSSVLIMLCIFLWKTLYLHLLKSRSGTMNATL